MTEQTPNPESIPVSPDQLSLLDDVKAESVTLEIPANAAQPTIHDAVREDVQETVQETAPVAPAETVDSGTKRTIITALLIVGVAGYIAYWVQEPLQIKADVTNPPAEESVMAEPSETEADAAAETASEGVSEQVAEAVTGPVQDVDVSLFGFEPATVSIDKGTTVVWTNTSTEDQTIIGSSDNGQSFASPVLTTGNRFSYTFDQDGTFEYYSTYNPALKASITVGQVMDTADEPAEAEDSLSPAADVLADAISEAETNTEPAMSEDGDVSTEVAAAETTGTTVATGTDEVVQQAPAEEELKPAAEAPTKLAKTGPAENLYLALFVIIGWLNRKKLYRAFGKQV